MTKQRDFAKRRMESWEFAGYGSSMRMRAPPADVDAIDSHLQGSHVELLSELPASAICGNDILSSVLYVSGLVTTVAGKMAPLALLLVSMVLYLFRSIYSEVVTTIPMNGGAYSVLLNTTRKSIAAFAASLAILSYIATGVVSATTAAAYFLDLFPSVNAIHASLVVLLLFAILVFLGISESASVAVGIYFMHIGVLTLLVLVSMLVAVGDGGDLLWHNMQTPYPYVDVAGKPMEGNFGTALLFGFASAMLGVSGFETSSQYVQEQQDGVFVKTLRNMWLGVTIFNPLLSLLSLAVMPVDEIIENHSTVLSAMAKVAGDKLHLQLSSATETGDVSSTGDMLQTLVCVDAVLVLCGGVLTAYVGVNGLIRRMAQDRCLPQALLAVNKWRGTNHVIIFGYFALSSSLLLVLHGDVTALSGVYTFSFLGVMSLFSVGCMLLKYKRPEFPRVFVCPWPVALTGFALVVLALLGNIVSRPDVLVYFALYFITVLTVVFTMFNRTVLLRLTIRAFRHVFPSADFAFLAGEIKRINQQAMVFLAKHDDLSLLNKAVLYVRENEQTSRLLVVHVYRPEEGLEPGFQQSVALIDSIYPKLTVDFLAVEGSFSPGLIGWLSLQLDVPQNMMMIACPSAEFKHKIEQMGGVRIITK